jgi:phosphoglycolate phosphatase
VAPSTDPCREQPALLFDLDGTLTDPSDGIVRCLRHALTGLGRACPSDAALAALIGPPLRSNLAALLATRDAALVERAVALYRERFGEVGLFENRVYDGVPDMLRQAAALAQGVFVATSKPTVYAERIVERFGLARHIARVYGSELDGRFEDKGDLIAHLLDTEGIPPRAAVMVGDRAVDIAGARANGLRSIGALWGFGAEGELADAGADLLCPAPGELGACVRRLARSG